MSVWMDGWMDVIERLSNHSSYSFSTIFTKLGTHDLCANMHETGTDFRNFPFTIFCKVFKILNFSLVSGTVAAELYRSMGLPLVKYVPCVVYCVYSF